jgi:hypothetical protein
MADVHQRKRGATTVYEDNEGAFKLANSPMASNRIAPKDQFHHARLEVLRVSQQFYQHHAGRND